MSNSNDWRSRATAVSSGPSPIDIAAAFSAAPARKSSVNDATDEHETPQRLRRKSLSWVEWGGLTLALGLLVTTFVMSSRQQHIVSDSGDHATGRTSSRAALGAAILAEPRMTSVTTASSPGEPAFTSSREQRVERIANNLVDNAGNGNFALGESFGNTAAEPPDSDDHPSESPTKSPPVFKPAPDPVTILPIARSADKRDPDKPLRSRLAFPVPSPAFVSFERLYPLAFASHQAYIKQKQTDPTTEGCRKSLIETVTLFRQCLGRPIAEVNDEQRFQIQYTLAGLYRDAGHLYEASVWAIHVARFADPSQPIAKAAAALAFSALQEAHENHFGDPQSPGELEQMITLCDLIKTRGIKLPQLATMRFGIGQLLERDGFYVRAAQTYAKVPKSSPLFAKAQLEAGRVFWAEAIRRESEGVEEQRDAIASCAAKYLDIAIEQMGSDQNATPAQLAGKVARAQIALRREDPETAILLLDGDDGVLRQPGKNVKLSDEFMTAAYEYLFQAYSQAEDLVGMQSTLENLSKRYGADGNDRITRLYRKIVTDFVDDLPADQPITLIQVNQLDAVMRSVLEPKRDTNVNGTLWAAQVWEGLGSRTQDGNVATLCLQRSDDLLRIASESTNLDAAQKLALQLKRIDLAQQVGNVTAALDLLSEILRQSPSAIDLQIKAAKLLVDAAEKTGQAADFALAIAGRPDDAIWGWARLTNSLARMHFDSDDQSRYLGRLLESGFQLDECRFRQAQLTTPSAQRKRLVDSTKSHVRQILTTFAQSSEKWTKQFEMLQANLIELQ